MKPKSLTDFQMVRETAMAILAKREPWLKEWQRIADAMLPYAVQIQGRRGNEDKSARKDKDILNDMPSRALEDLSAGLMSRITSPAREWFGLQVTDQGTSADDASVSQESKKYLDRIKEIVKSMLQRGGWYSVLGMSTYLDMAAFGTACIFMDEQKDGSVVYDAVPVGRFAIDCDHLGKVDSYVREWAATAQQCAKRFGRKDLPQDIANALRQNDYKTEFEILHVILPLEKPNRFGHRWSSTWFVKGCTDDVLSQGGYFEFPVLCPRWSVRSGDVYGRGPGWKALGNIRALQHNTRGMIQMLDRVIDPPKAVIGGKGKLSFLPGAVSHVSAAAGVNVAVEDLLKIDPRHFEEVRAEIARLEDAIDDAFFGKLWKMFTDEDRSDITAAEIEARRQEQALRAGPLLESLNGELLEPAVEKIIEMLLRNGRLTDFPEALSKKNIKVEFISIMHQMQQATAMNALRAFLNDVQALMAMRPEVIDHINPDNIVHEFARASGVRADTLNSMEEVKKLRAAKAAAQKKAIAGQEAAQFAKGVKDIGSVNPDNLTQTAGALARAAAAQGGAVGAVA